jgi:two-component system nitrogen regulation response regulator NtrX
MIDVLVVEDDENYRYEISQELELNLGDEARFHYASNLAEAIAALEKIDIQLVLLDIIFPSDAQKERQGKVDYQAGVKFLQQLVENGFRGNVVVLSSQSKNFAVDLLIRFRQVRDYIFKDSPWKEIYFRVERQIQDLTEKYALLQNLRRVHPLIGCSPAIERIKVMAEKLADSDSTILLSGESGVGKEVVANYFHGVSGRCKGPFVVVNCAAIPESLFESQLFGYRRGSFTGADEERDGCFVAAQGGTLFLDEIGELPLPMQVKLLRVLQEKQVVPVGEVRPRSVDVRVITATNRNLEELVQKKEFREDLFYRLKVFPVIIPPLRERPEDIPVLTDYFLELIFSRTGLRKSFSDEVCALFKAYGWPGNVRELKNTIERLIILTDKNEICYEDVLPLLPCTRQAHYRVQFPVEESDYKKVKQGVMEAFHQSFFSYHLKMNNHNIARTAEKTGYNRNDLSAIVKKLAK